MWKCTRYPPTCCNVMFTCTMKFLCEWNWAARAARAANSTKLCAISDVEMNEMPSSMLKCIVDNAP